MMPSSRGSCTGSGVLLDLALTGRGPAALIFSGDEDVLTLGALIAAEMFGCNLPVLRLSDTAYTALAAKDAAQITADRIEAAALSIPITPPAAASLALTDRDRSMLSGDQGQAVQQAMRIICAMAANQGAAQLMDCLLYTSRCV